jgi:hypothetical protein
MFTSIRFLGNWHFKLPSTKESAQPNGQETYHYFDQGWAAIFTQIGLS